jgi:hypothetical protein
VVGLVQLEQVELHHLEELVEEEMVEYIHLQLHLLQERQTQVEEVVVVVVQEVYNLVVTEVLEL